MDLKAAKVAELARFTIQRLSWITQAGAGDYKGAENWNKEAAQDSRRKRGVLGDKHRDEISAYPVLMYENWLSQVEVAGHPKKEGTNPRLHKTSIRDYGQKHVSCGSKTGGSWHPALWQEEGFICEATQRWTWAVWNILAFFRNY
jgi:hypothetical protein